MMNNDSFYELLMKAHQPGWTPPTSLLALDPGETTGWALFEQGRLAQQGEIEIPTFKDTRIDADHLWSLFIRWQPHVVVIEGYRVYAQKSKAHIWNALYTPKLIGYVEAICQSTPYGVDEYYIQMASTKQFCDDGKLKDWGYYLKGKRHSRDAVRHGCYWLLFFGRSKEKRKEANS